MTTVTIGTLLALVGVLLAVTLRLTRVGPTPAPEPPPLPPEPTPGPSPGPTPAPPLPRTYTIDSDLRPPGGVTAPELDAFFRGYPLEGLGRSFVAAEAKYALNAVYLSAHAAWESDYGRSKIARDKDNLFGYGASGPDPYANARTFPNFEACIDFVAGYVARAYLDPAGQFYGGAPSLRGMNVNYATDQNWKNGIAALMNEIARPAPRAQVTKSSASPVRIFSPR
ncbi:MAG TPA: glucosaminidase domain-containing protein [Bacillota bacterium]